MKKLLLGVLLLGSISTANAVSLRDFISDRLKNGSEGITAFNLHEDKVAGVYVSFRSLNWPTANILDAGVGGLFGAGHPDGIMSARINLPQIANGIFGTSWFTAHTTGPELPTLFIGPAVKSEWPINKWTWGKDVYLAIGIPFGSVGL